MTYIKVKWKHSNPDEPVLLYSELDPERWETRKVEIFSDGSMGYACAGICVGGTRLGLVPVPSLEQIADEPQFEPETISKAEFEKIWSKAK